MDSEDLTDSKYSDECILPTLIDDITNILVPILIANSILKVWTHFVNNVSIKQLLTIIIGLSLLFYNFRDDYKLFIVSLTYISIGDSISLLLGVWHPYRPDEINTSVIRSVIESFYYLIISLIFLMLSTCLVHYYIGERLVSIIVSFLVISVPMPFVYLFEMYLIAYIIGFKQKRIVWLIYILALIYLSYLASTFYSKEECAYMSFNMGSSSLSWRLKCLYLVIEINRNITSAGPFYSFDEAVNKKRLKRGDILEINRGCYSHAIIFESYDKCYHITSDPRYDSPTTVFTCGSAGIHAFVSRQPLKYILSGLRGQSGDILRNDTPPKLDLLRVNNLERKARILGIDVNACNTEVSLNEMFQQLDSLSVPTKPKTLDNNHLTNNCEHFAYGMKFKQILSSQIHRCLLFVLKAALNSIRLLNLETGLIHLDYNHLNNNCENFAYEIQFEQILSSEIYRCLLFVLKAALNSIRILSLEIELKLLDYNLLTNNCELFDYGMKYNQKLSPQIQAFTCAVACARCLLFVLKTALNSIRLLILETNLKLFIYNFFINNCEHFVYGKKYKHKLSSQIQNVTYTVAFFLCLLFELYCTIHKL